MPIVNPLLNRRHFLSHAAGGAAATMCASSFLTHLKAHAAEVRSNQKACILVWLPGGAPTIDMWDLKPNSKNGGEFKPISTAGDMQISEHLPNTAKVMDSLSIVRSMGTREADHDRGSYYMHTGYVPNPTVTHPSFGSVVSYELGRQRRELEIPSFISIGGGGMSPGFLGMAHAPFVVDRRGQIANANGRMDEDRLKTRLRMLEAIEDGFIKTDRGELPKAHKDVYQQAVNLMTSEQMKAFQYQDETPETLAGYGDHEFGNSLVMARRLVETGVPFVEVRFPMGWDMHQDVHATLRDQNLPVLDTGLAGLVNDLKQRGLWDHTAVVVMGEFGRTPRINNDAGRDHWARSWSVVCGGAGMQGGRAIGETNEDGTEIVGQSYLPGDLWATVAQSLGIPLSTVHTSKRGRPMKIANGGSPIADLIS